jgi:hypothetical protein
LSYEATKWGRPSDKFGKNPDPIMTKSQQVWHDKVPDPIMTKSQQVWHDKVPLLLLRLAFVVLHWLGSLKNLERTVKEALLSQKHVFFSFDLQLENINLFIAWLLFSLKIYATG